MANNTSANWSATTANRPTVARLSGTGTDAAEADEEEGLPPIRSATALANLNMKIAGFYLDSGVCLYLTLAPAWGGAFANIG
jgi:hypothetical protein